MAFLDELEKKVFQIIQKNQDLEKKTHEMALELAAMKEKCDQLEVSLLKEAEKAQVLIQEKDTMRLSVEQLLNSIRVLEEAR